MVSVGAVGLEELRLTEEWKRAHAAIQQGMDERTRRQVVELEEAEMCVELKEAVELEEHKIEVEKKAQEKKRAKKKAQKARGRVAARVIRFREEVAAVSSPPAVSSLPAATPPAVSLPVTTSLAISLAMVAILVAGFMELRLGVAFLVGLGGCYFLRTHGKRKRVAASGAPPQPPLGDARGGDGRGRGRPADGGGGGRGGGSGGTGRGGRGGGDNGGGGGGGGVGGGDGGGGNNTVGDWEVPLTPEQLLFTRHAVNTLFKSSSKQRAEVWAEVCDSEGLRDLAHQLIAMFAKNKVKNKIKLFAGKPWGDVLVLDSTGMHAHRESRPREKKWRTAVLMMLPCGVPPDAPQEGAECEWEENKGWVQSAAYIQKQKKAEESRRKQYNRGPLSAQSSNESILGPRTMFKLGPEQRDASAPSDVGSGKCQCDAFPSVHDRSDCGHAGEMQSGIAVDKRSRYLPESDSPRDSDSIELARVRARKADVGKLKISVVMQHKHAGEDSRPKTRKKRTQDYRVAAKAAGRPANIVLADRGAPNRSPAEAASMFKPTWAEVRKVGLHKALGWWWTGIGDSEW